MPCLTLSTAPRPEAWTHAFPCFAGPEALCYVRCGYPDVHRRFARSISSLVQCAALVVAAGGCSLFSPGKPEIDSLSPAAGLAGSTVHVVVTGDDFPDTTRLTIDGAGIAVSDVRVEDRVRILATLTIAADAPLGTRRIKVSTTGGTATRDFTVNAAPPPAVQLFGVSPDSVPVGGRVVVEFSGANFNGQSTLEETSGLGGFTISGATVLDSRSIQAEISASPTGPIGERSFRVVTGTQATAPQIFTIVAPPPTISSVTPASATAGRTVELDIRGSEFVFGGTTVTISGTGAAISNVRFGGGTLRAAHTIGITLTIESTAAPGARSITVSTVGGTATFTFQVAASQD